MRRHARRRCKKNDGLATLANQLKLEAGEGSEMNDDEFDAVICAVTGCIPDCTLDRESLRRFIRSKLIEEYGQSDWISKVEPPDGYVVFQCLPEGIQIHVNRVECPTPSRLLSALCTSDIEPVNNRPGRMNPNLDAAPV